MVKNENLRRYSCRQEIISGGKESYYGKSNIEEERKSSRPRLPPRLATLAQVYNTAATSKIGY